MAIHTQKITIKHDKITTNENVYCFPIRQFNSAEMYVTCASQECYQCKAVIDDVLLLILYTHNLSC